MSIRDELFETFRKRHKGVMEPEEVLLTSNSLHRLFINHFQLNILYKCWSCIYYVYFSHWSSPPDFRHTYFHIYLHNTPMNGSWGDFILSMSMSLLGFLVGRVRIFWFGSWIVVVSLMCDPFILLYWKPLLFLSLGRAFGV